MNEWMTNWLTDWMNEWFNQWLNLSIHLSIYQPSSQFLCYIYSSLFLSACLTFQSMYNPSVLKVYLSIFPDSIPVFVFPPSNSYIAPLQQQPPLSSPEFLLTDNSLNSDSFYTNVFTLSILYKLPPSSLLSDIKVNPPSIHLSIIVPQQTNWFPDKHSRIDR